MITSKRNILILLIAIVVNIIEIQSQGNMKSSLVFLIDSSGSMVGGIRGLKERADDIFNAISQPNAAVENVALVTFNDLDVSPVVVTKDKNTFKSALDAIVTSFGGDCPEYSMSGIEKALNFTLPGSYLYVLTDASAKDYIIYDDVLALAQTKKSQINFILTGFCGESDDNAPGIKEYYGLSRATNGQVFKIFKSELERFIEYVIHTIKTTRILLASGAFSAGKNELSFTMSHDMIDVTISVAGKNPQVECMNPNDEKTVLEDIIKKENIAIYRVNSTISGVYNVIVQSDSNSTVLVTSKKTDPKV